MSNFLVTAGPTREYLDSVRFLSNASTGLTGFLIAEVAHSRNHNVILVKGPTSKVPLEGPEVIDVISARDMADAVLEHLQWADVLIGTAAVCDWRPQKRFSHKLSKKQEALKVNWVRNPDILLLAGQQKMTGENKLAGQTKPGNRLHIGFALEDKDGEEKAEAKLKRKNLDYIVLNGPENMGSEEGAYTLFSKNNKIRHLDNLTKRKLAEILVDLSTTGEDSLNNF